MKKLLFVMASLALSAGAFAQTIVSTEVQQRNLVFEEYTGVNCGYCPNGHATINGIAATVPGRVVVANIHQGYYAAQYKTKWGDALANQTDLNGYPAFTANRIVHNCKVTNYYSNTYNIYNDGNALLAENSPLNIAATAEVDAATRIMTIHVEVYYTADVNQSANMLNIYLLQNNIIGPQSNYGDFNPDFIISSSGNSTVYRHMHMFRDMITNNQWGDEIAVNEDGVIPAGTFVEKDYTYTIPEAISNEDVVLGDLELMIFVADKEMADCPDLNAPNIWTGIEAVPSYTGLTENAASVSSIDAIGVYGCTDQANVFVKVRNMGSADLTGMTIKYSTAEEPDGKTYDWTGNVATFEVSEEIALPESITVKNGKASSIKVEITSINGVALDEPVALTQSYTKPATPEKEGALTMILRTDKNGNQITWKVTNSNGDVVQQGGPYDANKVTRDTVVLTGMTTADCYLFELNDSGEDGAGSAASCKFLAPDGSTVSTIKGTWGGGFVADFKITAIVGLNEANENIFQSIVYPNPAKDVATLSVNLVKADNATINVVDLMGREVMNLGTRNLNSGENQIQINTSDLADGLYYVRVITNNGIVTNKLNVTK